MAHLHHEMESFLPSEIARLVYGYLEEEECNDAAQAFLETSMHLKECLAVSRKGRKFSTKIYGLSLVDLFDLLTETLCLVKENSKVLKETSSISSRLLSLLHSDSGISDSVIKDHNADISDDSFMAKDNESIDLENQQIRNVYPGKNTSVKNDSSQKQNDLDNKEVPSFLCTGQANQISEKDGFSPHFIKIKEENETEDCGFELEENHDEEDVAPGIEPEVQILSPDGQFQTEAHQTVNMITNPIMVGRAPQLICPPYSMVHMVPAYPTPAHPSLPTTLFMPQQGITSPQHPITVHHSQAIIQTTGTAVSSQNNQLPTVWPKPKSSQNNQAPALRTYKRAADYATTQMGNKDSKVSKLKSNVYQGSSKLRPIAPKITQSLDNGVKMQVVYTKENPLIAEPNPYIQKVSLRSRRKTAQKSEQACAGPLFIDIQDICNEN